MSQNTAIRVNRQGYALVAHVPFAIHGPLLGITLGVSLLLALAAPPVALAGAAHGAVAPPPSGHTRLAGGPQIWGCGAAPTPC